MADTIRYGKPNMGALEGDWGRKIIEEILNSPPIDREDLKRRAEAALLENKLAKEAD